MGRAARSPGMAPAAAQARPAWSGPHRRRTRYPGRPIRLTTATSTLDTGQPGPQHGCQREAPAQTFCGRRGHRGRPIVGRHDELRLLPHHHRRSAVLQDALPPPPRDPAGSRTVLPDASRGRPGSLHQGMVRSRRSGRRSRPSSHTAARLTPLIRRAWRTSDHRRPSAAGRVALRTTYLPSDLTSPPGPRSPIAQPWCARGRPPPWRWSAELATSRGLTIRRPEDRCQHAGRLSGPATEATGTDGGSKWPCITTAGWRHQAP